MAGGITRAGILFRKLLSGRAFTYAELKEAGKVDRRTALRWIREAKEIFGERLREEYRDTGEKEFWLEQRDGWMRRLQHEAPTSEEMAAVDAALAALQRLGMSTQQHDLTALRGKLHATLIDLEKSPKTENDAEALGLSLGIASRPGPRFPVSLELTATLRKAIQRRHMVVFNYQPRGRPVSRKKVAPAGLLYGGAPRLVGRPEGKSWLGQYRLDRTSKVEILSETHDLEEDALRSYLRTLFGSFGEKPVSVRWRFHPNAPDPEKWVFHPTQSVTKEPDGSVVVSFRAGGLDDMARHVIGWWDWIEVEIPKSLRRRVLELKLAGLAPLLEEFADPRLASRIGRLAAALGASQVEKPAG